MEDQTPERLAEPIPFYRASFEQEGIAIREASEADGMPTLVTRFAAYNNWNEIYSPSESRQMGLPGKSFMEFVVPGAFSKSIAERSSQIQVLFNHGSDGFIGKKVLGSISRFEETDEGPQAEVDLYDTDYNRQLLPGLRDGRYGASYAADVVKGDVVKRAKKSDHNPKGLPEVTVTEIRMKEFGPVTFPAESKTTAGVRSLTDRLALVELADRIRQLAEDYPDFTEIEAAALEGAGLEAEVAEAVAEASKNPRSSRRTSRRHTDYLNTKEVKPSWQL